MELVFQIDVEHVRQRGQHAFRPLVLNFKNRFSFFLHDLVEDGVVGHLLDHLSALLVSEGEI